MKVLRFSAFALALLVAIASCAQKEETPEKDQKENKGEGTTTEAPAITAQDTNVLAQAGTYTLAVSVANPVEGKNLSASLVEAADWITLGAPTADGVPVKVGDNLSAARSVQVKLSYEGAKDVTVNLTQDQWKYSEFDIAISKLGPFGATFTITRKAGYHGGYFFEVLGKSSFDSYVKDETNKVGDFNYGNKLYESDVNYLNSLAQQHGHPLSHLFGMLGSMYSKEDQTEMPYSSLDIDTDYVFIVYGMEDSDAATRKTAMCFYEFHTGISSSSELSFSGQASDIIETSATISVTPSNNTEYWYLDWASEIQLQGTTPAEIMQKANSNAKTLVSRGYKAEEVLCKGKDEFQATELMPGTEYTVFAWGMDVTTLEATTEPQVAFKFKTKDYSIIDDCTFQIQVLEIEDMDIQIKVTPSNLSTRYYAAFVEKSKMAGYNDTQAAQRIINMEAQRISNGEYDVPDLSWANLPGLEAGVRTIWGRRDEGWTFQPNHDYRIYVFGIDNLGIRTTVVETLDVTTAAPGESNNHFEVTIDSNAWNGLYYTVTPEIEDEYWLPFVAETSDIDTYFRNADGSLKEQELFAWIEEYYEDEITSTARRGTRQLYQHVTPDTDYSIIIFGYAGSYTTKMYEWQVYVPKPPFNTSSADYSYSYELFRGEDLTALDPTLFPAVDFEGDCIMVVRVEPNAQAAHWYFGCWPPKENYREQGGLYYLMTLDMNPDVAGSAMQDKKFFRNRPWWYGCGSGSATKKEPWSDDEGNVMNYYPWTLSGWAEDAEGNYGPWHYEYLIPVPLPKDDPNLGPYEVGYTTAYKFWETSNSASMQVFSVNTGKPISVKQAKYHK